MSLRPHLLLLLWPLALLTACSHDTGPAGGHSAHWYKAQANTNPTGPVMAEMKWCEGVDLFHSKHPNASEKEAMRRVNSKTCHNVNWGVGMASGLVTEKQINDLTWVNAHMALFKKEEAWCNAFNGGDTPAICSKVMSMSEQVWNEGGSGNEQYYINRLAHTQVVTP